MGYYFLGENFSNIMPNCMLNNCNITMPNFFTSSVVPPVFDSGFGSFSAPNLYSSSSMPLFSSQSYASFSAPNFFSTWSVPNFSLPGFSVVSRFQNMCRSMFDTSSVFNNSFLGYNNFSPNFDIFTSTITPSQKVKTKYGADLKYLNYTSTSEAASVASKDPNLEKLKNTDWVTISDANFRTDIPYAKKGTTNILNKVGNKLGIKLTVTSALGTGTPGNPHKKGSCSHHNAKNPKLDFAIPKGETADSFAKKLRGTGYFSHVLAEGNHVDVQIDIDKFA